jgi:hypothetical protein
MLMGRGEYCIKTERSEVVMDKGKMKSYVEKGDSGKTIDRLFCPDCGSYVLHTAHNLVRMSDRQSRADDDRRTIDVLEIEPEHYYVHVGMSLTVLSLVAPPSSSCPGLFPPGSSPSPTKHIFAKYMEEWDKPYAGAEVHQGYA